MHKYKYLKYKNKYLKLKENAINEKNHFWYFMKQYNDLVNDKTDINGKLTSQNEKIIIDFIKNIPIYSTTVFSTKFLYEFNCVFLVVPIITFYFIW